MGFKRPSSHENYSVAVVRKSQRDETEPNLVTYQHNIKLVKLQRSLEDFPRELHERGTAYDNDYYSSPAGGICHMPH